MDARLAIIYIDKVDNFGAFLRVLQCRVYRLLTELYVTFRRRALQQCPHSAHRLIHELIDLDIGSLFEFVMMAFDQISAMERSSSRQRRVASIKGDSPFWGRSRGYGQHALATGCRRKPL